MKKNNQRSSDALLEIANNKDLDGEITYQRIIDTLGERAFGIVLLFFALPSALPFSAIPGVSFIFSVPILLFAFQMIFARKTLWLPKIVANRTIHQEAIAKIIHTATPYIIKVEYFLKPRWPFMNSRFMEIMNGVVICCLAVLLMLPIPLSNFIFSSLLIIFGMGLIEKDGLFILLGYIGAIFYICFIYMFIMKTISYLFH
ncbi:exopolysaccharide biosynthesis protein [Legionella maioricensis]|uniref:Exopolysaccharide biosynthesis protein n=1 Tax=Legionella maioricensis TaxID=2896528 RepID=A0A9X2D1T7_9GAMM|nr:exopolysaccharide biosynthesis protein [Legionella maioricensis]MCL9685075.1 exopolysaccharide biosynthesis protein [Legionella maioricensis]MCL9688164.1 exopolysaccharide biosynthesis protein [Legionella maioricensis]